MNFVAKTAYQVPIAQLDRASDCGSEGRWFESTWVRIRVCLDSLERCPSGLRSTPGTRVYRQRYRGFESLSLRLWLGLGLCVAVQPRQVRKEAAAYRFSRNPIPLSRVFDSKINHCGLYFIFYSQVYQGLASIEDGDKISLRRPGHVFLSFF